MSARQESSLITMASAYFARCKPDVVPVVGEGLQQIVEWKHEHDLEGSEPRNVNDLMSYHHAQWLLATKDRNLITMKDALRGNMAGIIAAISLIQQKSAVTLDGVLHEDDRGLRLVITDEDNLHAVEESARKAQAAEEAVLQLKRDKESLELSLMELQEKHQNLLIENQMLKEKEMGLQTALSDSKAQASVVPVSSELSNRQGELHELARIWMVEYRSAIKEKYRLADSVADTLRLIQLDKAIMEAIGKSPLVNVAFKFAIDTVNAIPG